MADTEQLTVDAGAVTNAVANGQVYVAVLTAFGLSEGALLTALDAHRTQEEVTAEAFSRQIKEARDAVLSVCTCSNCLKRT